MKETAEVIQVNNGGSTSDGSTNTAVELEKIKAVYFSTKYMNVKNFLKIKNITLPEGITADDIVHWNREKKELIESSSISYKGIKEMYAEALQDRLDFIETINAKLLDTIAGLDDIKEIKTLVQALETASKLQDDTIKTLNIDTTSNEDYDNNKSATDDLLKIDEDE